MNRGTKIRNQLFPFWRESFYKFKWSGHQRCYSLYKLPRWFWSNCWPCPQFLSCSSRKLCHRSLYSNNLSRGQLCLVCQYCSKLLRRRCHLQMIRWCLWYRYFRPDSFPLLLWWLLRRKLLCSPRLWMLWQYFFSLFFSTFSTAAPYRNTQGQCYTRAAWIWQGAQYTSFWQPIAITSYSSSSELIFSSQKSSQICPGFRDGQHTNCSGSTHPDPIHGSQYC